MPGNRRGLEQAATFSSGMAHSLDLVIGVPYQWLQAREIDRSVSDYVLVREKGQADISVELKWRFYEQEGLSLAIKPGVRAPAGSEQEGLGAGKYGSARSSSLRGRANPGRCT